MVLWGPFTAAKIHLEMELHRQIEPSYYEYYRMNIIATPKWQ